MTYRTQLIECLKSCDAILDPEDAEHLAEHIIGTVGKPTAETSLLEQLELKYLELKAEVAAMAKQYPADAMPDAYYALLRQYQAARSAMNEQYHKERTAERRQPKCECNDTDTFCPVHNREDETNPTQLERDQRLAAAIVIEASRRLQLPPREFSPGTVEIAEQVLNGENITHDEFQQLRNSSAATMSVALFSDTHLAAMIETAGRLWELSKVDPDTLNGIHGLAFKREGISGLSNSDIVDILERPTHHVRKLIDAVLSCDSEGPDPYVMEAQELATRLYY